MDKQERERLELLASAVEQISDGIVLSDLHGHLLYINRAFAAMHGYQPEELLGEHLSVFHTDDQMTVVEDANRQLQKKGQFTGEIWHKRRDGSVFPAIMHNAVLRDETGQPIGMIGTLRDITEQRQATAALRESEELYSTLVETSPDAVTVSDLEGKITFVSTRTVELHGCTSKEDLIGRSAMDFIAPKERKRAAKNMQKTLEKGGIKNIEYLLMRVDGSQFVGELNASAIRTVDGNAKAFIATVRDITDRKRAEDELRQTTKELKAKHEALLEKNIALTEILNHIEDQRQDYKQQICREIEQAILPVMQRARLEENTSYPKMLENLEANLKAILSRDIDVLRNRLSKLSPREIEICDLIKRGKTSKEISDILSLALTTVQTHRQQIRRKLEIAGKEVNLSTFLRMS